jgi:hypothetical protein
MKATLIIVENDKDHQQANESCVIVFTYPQTD